MLAFRRKEQKAAASSSSYSTAEKSSLAVPGGGGTLTANRRSVSRNGSERAKHSTFPRSSSAALRLGSVLCMGLVLGYTLATWSSGSKGHTSNNISTLAAPNTVEEDASMRSSHRNQKQQQKQQQRSSTARLVQQCTKVELTVIEHQLPATDCVATLQKPWENKCSFSYATRCPDAVWLTELYQDYAKRGRTKAEKTATTKSAAPVVQAVYVGCNKAMDAVHTLRMISGNSTIDRDVWRTTFFGSSTTSSSNTKQQQPPQFEAGRCGQENGEQFAIVKAKKTIQATRSAVVHCIEAMPVTASRLNQTAHTLSWQSQLWVRNVAMSDTDGTILFPNTDMIGVENRGIENCQGATEATSECQSVPLLRLDTYLQRNPVVADPTTPTAASSKSKPAQVQSQDGRIDFLSIDVEGFDYPVLLGAKESLRRINYLEFEYNWKGQWKEHRLSTAIAMLKDAGFVCYWPGAFGHLWRITDCWLDHYDLKFWSNVACVNTDGGGSVNPWLARRMEDMFQRTLQKGGQKIQYDSVATANTNGGWQAKT